MKSVFTILFLSMLISCQSNDNEISAGPLPEKTLMKISYGTDSLQAMDIYLPKGRSSDSTPLIVLIHGGGWNGGTRREFSSYIDTFRQRMPHWAIANVDYRLVGGGHIFPSQEMDIKKALEFIVSKSDEFAINENNIVLLGASAGGHLALLQAYKYENPAIKGVIDLFGPTDLITMYNEPWHPLVPYALQTVTGTTPSQNLALYQQSSPVYHVKFNSPPTLILHGELDHIVSISQSKSLKKALDNAGVRNEFIIYPNERHGWYGSAMQHSYEKMIEFLKSVE